MTTEEMKRRIEELERVVATLAELNNVPFGRTEPRKTATPTGEANGNAHGRVTETHTNWKDEPCDCDMERVDCWACGGEGDFDEYDDDPINYAPGEEFSACNECRGRGFFRLCYDRFAPGDARDE